MNFLERCLASLTGCQTIPTNPTCTNSRISSLLVTRIRGDIQRQTDERTDSWSPEVLSFYDAGAHIGHTVDCTNGFRTSEVLSWHSGASQNKSRPEKTTQSVSSSHMRQSTEGSGTGTGRRSRQETTFDHTTVYKYTLETTATLLTTRWASRSRICTNSLESLSGSTLCTTLTWEVVKCQVNTLLTPCFSALVHPFNTRCPSHRQGVKKGELRDAHPAGRSRIRLC